MIGAPPRPPPPPPKPPPPPAPRPPPPASGTAPPRGRPDALLGARAKVVAAHVAVLRLGIDDGPVRGILPRVEPVAPRYLEPVGVDRPGGGSEGARPAPRVVVLQAAAHVVR